MWVIVLLLVSVSVLAWVFLGISLKKQFRFATRFTDMLPLYPVLSICPTICLSIAGTLWLSPVYSLCLFIVSLVIGLLFVIRFYKWGKMYRWNQYREFLKELKADRYTVSLFSEYEELKSNQSAVAVFIRHDVDISLPRALKMAEIEKEMGIASTYFFRMHAEKYTFEEAIPIIQQLLNDGFGIGLHYDMVTYTKGNKEKAIALFQEDLARLREIAPVHYVCAHGHKTYKNRDIWANVDQEALEVYSAYDLDRDMYISDAGGKSLIDTQGKHILKRIDKAQPGQIIQVLIHPDWWF